MTAMNKTVEELRARWDAANSEHAEICVAEIRASAALETALRAYLAALKKEQKPWPIP